MYLYLNDNALTGSIPSELGSLTSLSHLALWDNPALAGPVPAAVEVAAARVEEGHGRNTGSPAGGVARANR